MRRLLALLLGALSALFTVLPLHAQYPPLPTLGPPTPAATTPLADGPFQTPAIIVGFSPAWPAALNKSDAGSVLSGGSLYLLRPYFQNNTAYRTTIGLLSPSPEQTTTNFDWDATPAFALWTGYQISDNFGVRARWFQFEASSNTLQTSLLSPAAVSTSIVPSQYLPALPLAPGSSLFGSPGLLLNAGLGQDNLTFSSSLRIDAVDAEMTWDWNCGNWKFLAGIGGRFLYMNQTYDARLSNKLSDGVTSELQTLNFSHNFYGGGPTIDLQANWKLGSTNLFLYALGRGSMLIGQSVSSTAYTQSVHDPLGKTNGGAFPVVSFINPSVTNSSNNVIPVTEFELGLDYSRDWGRFNYFARSAIATQTYFGAGNASRTDGNFSLFGVQFSLGLRF